MGRLRALARLGGSAGLATVEYVVGAAVVLGTLAVGVSSWNNGMVARLEAMVTQVQAVR